jgi:hypothetical protein
VRDRLEPLLAKLGSDALCASSCRQPLARLVERIYSVPGLLPQLQAHLEAPPGPGAALPADPRGVAWFALSAALHVDGARTDDDLAALAGPLAARGGAASAEAARQLLVLSGRAGGGGGGGGDGDGGDPQGAAVGVEDLASGPGGRHDNDLADFRRGAPPPPSLRAATPAPPPHSRATRLSRCLLC